jgi:hypothetical protein
VRTVVETPLDEARVHLHEVLHLRVSKAVAQGVLVRYSAVVLLDRPVAGKPKVLCAHLLLLHDLFESCSLLRVESRCVHCVYCFFWECGRWGRH